MSSVKSCRFRWRYDSHHPRLAQYVRAYWYAVQFETHRNCITNDLFSTLLLLDAIPEMRLCADLSHFIVDREFKLPMARHEMQYISRILERSDSFQGRVASRQQIQLQLDFPQHQPWVEAFKGWWREGLVSWRARHDAGDCIFLCELGRRPNMP